MRATQFLAASPGAVQRDEHSTFMTAGYCAPVTYCFQVAMVSIPAQHTSSVNQGGGGGVCDREAQVSMDLLGQEGLQHDECGDEICAASPPAPPLACDSFTMAALSCPDRQVHARKDGEERAPGNRGREGG